MIFVLEFSKGHDSVKNVGGVTDGALYFFPSFMKISQRLSEETG